MTRLSLGPFSTGFDKDQKRVILHGALSFAQQIGSENLLAAVELNLGAVGIDADPDHLDDVQAHLETGLALARKTSQSVFECIALTKLADLMIRQERWGDAGDFLCEAHTRATEIGDHLSFPIILRGWAQIRLAQGETEAALQDATQAVALSRQSGEAIELGIALRILGQVHQAREQTQAAMTAFAESMAVLGDAYPHERDLTQAQMKLCGL